MNKIINKCLFTEDKFMLELQLKQPGFTYSACRLIPKPCERIQKIREKSNLSHLYRNEFGKACFAQDAACSHSKDLAKRTVSHKIFKDSPYEIVKICKYGGYQ